MRRQKQQQQQQHQLQQQQQQLQQQQLQRPERDLVRAKRGTNASIVDYKYHKNGSSVNEVMKVLTSYLTNIDKNLNFIEISEKQSQLIYMTFDRIAGDKVYDDSGYGNHGALSGLSKLARDTGKCGHGLRFQGGTDINA